jgi:hypothetical protein
MSGYTLFRTFKYALFGLLLFNLFYYLVEDRAAFLYLGANPSLGQILESFAVTIDYVAWLILLVLFELETDVLSEDKLKGALKWFFNGAVTWFFSTPSGDTSQPSWTSISTSPPHRKRSVA